MTASFIAIQTPKKYLLNGMWLGPKKPRRVYVLVHGLTGSLFSLSGLAEALVGTDTAVLLFNNRGSGVVSRIRRLTPKTTKGYESKTAGGAHEVFAESVDDLDGAVRFAKKRGAKEVVLVGHSTGSQKSAYYLFKRSASPVSRAILLAPLSDYASVVTEVSPAALRRAVAYAKKLVASGKPHQLLPPNIWSGTCDAQRFLSLYTPNSAEEIFSYASPTKQPKPLRSIKKPMLVVLMGADEHADRPTRDIAAWFSSNLQHKQSSVDVVPHALHSFGGKDKAVASLIQKWMKQ